MIRRWTPDEIQYLRENYQQKMDAELAVYLDRPLHGIKNQKIKQGLRLTKAEAVRRRTEAQAAKYAETFIIWTPEQDQFLRENYPKFTAKEMSQKMSRSHASIKGRVAKLKITLPKRIRRKRQEVSRFQIGQPAWNKGIKGLHFSPDTEFKKGCRPANTRHDGDLSVRTDSSGIKYVYIRIALGEWVLFHRWIWEKNRGAIPESHVIRFVNGDSSDCRLINFEMITCREHVGKNHNREKASAAMKQVWAAGTFYEKDSYVAATLAPRDKELRVEYLKNPELIKTKRLQLKLRRAIKDVATADTE